MTYIPDNIFVVQPREKLYLPHQLLGHRLVLGVQGDALDSVDL